jgi:hypothetical protein
MSRWPSIACLCAIALSVICALSAGAMAKASDPGSPQAGLIECSHGDEPAQRSAVFSGEMTQISGAVRMRMRFELQERIGRSKDWRGVDSPALRSWREADPGVTRFVYRQRVEGLKEATAYRMGVKFQWFDGDGERIAKGYEHSPTCRQRGKLANLGIRDDIHARQGPTGGTYRYVVLIHNNGKTSSPRTKLELRVDGAQVDVRPIGRLAPGERRTVRFVGPACKRSVKARLDPRDAVREITEADNVKRTRCDRVVLPG